MTNDGTRGGLARRGANSADWYKGWHKSWIKRSPTLEAMDQVPTHVLCKECQTYMRRDTDLGPNIIVILLLPVLFIVITSYLPYGHLAWYIQAGILVGVATGAAFSFRILPPLRRLSAEGDLLKGLMGMISWMESKHQEWQLPTYRRKACRKLESLARCVEGMTWVTPGRDTQSQARVVARASNVATSLRDLKPQLLMPDTDVWGEFKKELTGRLQVLLKTGWWNWPERVPDDLARKQAIRSRRWNAAASILTGMALLALGIWLTTLPRPIGVIAASFSLSIAAAILGRFGVAITSWKEMADIIKADSGKTKS